MNTRTCSKCGKERPARGFYFHEKYCKREVRINPLRERYKLEIANMSSERAEKFLRKAVGM